MSSRLFKKIVLSFLALVVAGFVGVAPAKAEEAKNLSKADVEQIIHDYIVNNAQVILNAVDDYQKKAATIRAEEGMKNNRDVLFSDAGSPEVGNPKGDVTVVEFFDYNCHYCKDVVPMILSVLEKDKNVRFIFKDFPILGPTSEAAAKWALAAHKQKKYFEFHQALMNNKTPINDAVLERIAKEVGMDADEAKKEAGSPGILVQIEKNRTLAADLGLNGTPAFIVGEEVTKGGMTQEDLEKKIAELRSKAKK